MGIRHFCARQIKCSKEIRKPEAEQSAGRIQQIR